MSYHGRNHYNLLKSQRKASDKHELSTNISEHSTASLTANKTVSSQPLTINKEQLDEPTGKIDVSRANHALRMSSVNHAVINNSGRKLAQVSKLYADNNAKVKVISSKAPT